MALATLYGPGRTNREEFVARLIPGSGEFLFGGREIRRVATEPFGVFQRSAFTG